jgi:hypothetical protein
MDTKHKPVEDGGGGIVILPIDDAGGPITLDVDGVGVPPAREKNCTVLFGGCGASIYNCL